MASPPLVSVLSVPALLAVFGCLGAGACTGELREKPLALSAVDAGDLVAECDPSVASPGSGFHNPGQACLSCHVAGGGAPAFTVGGTLYSDLAGNSPLAGATVHMIDADGADLIMITADNGNFWTAQPIAFPATTSASLCPDNRPMFTPITETGGDCNSAGCHTDGFRVSLP